ncbi:hypothetical protein EDD86DRAFT_197228 [Gorgonomyces haynaldii]|nr:hypothetical protein EDD86DRAFT_197228 [Gorgonomyces haynaldii]
MTTTIDELDLPQSQITTVSKRRIGEMMVNKGSKTVLTRTVTVFCQYVTMIAQELASQRKRRNIQGQDVLEALEIAGFPQLKDEITPMLSLYLATKAKPPTKRPVDTEDAKEQSGSVDDLESQGPTPIADQQEMEVTQQTLVESEDLQMDEESQEESQDSQMDETRDYYGFQNK